SELSKGHLIYQDINYRSTGSSWSFSFRIGFFNTDNYDNRIYTYENDVLNAFSVPAYYNSGGRVYLVVKYRINRSIQTWIKIARTFKERNNIGSGNQLINGNKKTDITFQLMWKF
ncbi:MAG: helix-hairpin-helix domain-containing protein, partial [Bacteroidetes bacterium]|nr:helix-hairpin-helix domain-containing protein [Bacteroidota bacterium]